MKIKDLLKELDKCKKEYGKKFLEWDVYVEALDGETLKEKEKQGFEVLWSEEYPRDTFTYIECAGFWTKMPKKKIFTININF